MKKQSLLQQSLSFVTIFAMIFGIAAGIAAKHFEWNLFIVISPFFEVFGKLWIILLLVLVIPLAGTYIFHVFIGLSNAKSIGKMGVFALSVHTLIYWLGVIVALAGGFLLIKIFQQNIPKFNTVAQAAELLESYRLGGANVKSILFVLGKMQQLLGKVVMYFVLLIFGCAVSISFLKMKIKVVIQKYSARYSAKMFGWLQYFLMSLPLAVFSLLFVFSLKEGLFAAGVVGYLISFLIVLLLILIAFQYVFAGFWGDVSLLHFSKSVFPSQLIAMSSRSSLATMPSLLECAEKRMGLSSATSGVIIPFFVTTFRVNYSISTTFSLIFLAHVFQVSVDFQTLAIFLVLQFLISFGSPGIPSGGHYLNVSFYLAAGIPIEGVLLMKAVDHIPDIFKTLLNVTEVMTLTTVTSKWGKKRGILN